MATYYWIEHRRGVYVGHKLRPQTGRESASYTWQSASTLGRRFDSRAEAERLIAEKKMMACKVVEKCK